MTDLFLTLASIALFSVALVYVKACDRLKVKKSND